MATETITKLIDDVDGGDADRTIRFSYNGMRYIIDLSDNNADEMDGDFQKWISHASIDKGERDGGAPRRGNYGGRRTTTLVGGAARQSDKDLNKAIRLWAESQGIKVAPRGRISDEVVAAFHNRHKSGQVTLVESSDEFAPPAPNGNGNGNGKLAVPAAAFNDGALPAATTSTGLPKVEPGVSAPKKKVARKKVTTVLRGRS